MQVNSLDYVSSNGQLSKKFKNMDLEEFMWELYTNINKKSYILYEYIIIKMTYTFNDLPFEISLMIAEMDHNIFAIMRLLNRDIREYTNNHIDKYKSKFSREVVLITEPHSLLKIEEKYFILPNGTKHGLYNALWKKYGRCHNYITYKSSVTCYECTYKDGIKNGLFEKYSIEDNERPKLIKRCIYENGKINGISEKYCTYKETYSITTYDNGIKNGLSEKYSIEDNEGRKLIKRCIYKNGKLCDTEKY